MHGPGYARTERGTSPILLSVVPKTRSPPVQIHPTHSEMTVSTFKLSEQSSSGLSSNQAFLLQYSVSRVPRGQSRTLIFRRVPICDSPQGIQPNIQGWWPSGPMSLRTKRKNPSAPCPAAEVHNFEGSNRQTVSNETVPVDDLRATVQPRCSRTRPMMRRCCGVRLRNCFATCDGTAAQ
ncbi:hypothetical protein H4582DRAFT_1067488 [Lactarius indigo]|nr:hypothetical protein H4582DRAFT_1067488 [Lactarius indigo]